MGSSPAGDFERFFAAAKPSLLRQAFVYTGNLEEAQDLTQETLLRVWRNWGHVSATGGPRGLGSQGVAQPRGGLVASASDPSEARGLEHGHAPTVRHGSSRPIPRSRFAPGEGAAGSRLVGGRRSEHLGDRGRARCVRGDSPGLALSSACSRGRRVESHSCSASKAR